MTSDFLEQFYKAENLRKAVHGFLLEVNDKLILKAVREKKDVTGYAENKELVDKAFSILHERYSEDKKLSNVNQAK